MAQLGKVVFFRDNTLIRCSANDLLQDVALPACARLRENVAAPYLATDVLVKVPGKRGKHLFSMPFWLL